MGLLCMGIKMDIHYEDELFNEEELIYGRIIY